MSLNWREEFPEWCPENGSEPASRTNRPTEKLSANARGGVWALERDAKSDSCCHPSMDMRMFYP
jgi:hypothetical protein